MGDCYSGMETEKLNPRTQNIDLCSAQEIVTMINQEDAKVADAVKEALPQIGEAVERIYKALREGGHLLYMFDGSSGRVGFLVS